MRFQELNRPARMLTHLSNTDNNLRLFTTTMAVPTKSRNGHPVFGVIRNGSVLTFGESTVAPQFMQFDPDSPVVPQY